MKNHFISPLSLAHQYIIIDFGFPCLLNIMIYFCFHSNTHFYSHSMQNRISYSISWVHIELCGKSIQWKLYVQLGGRSFICFEIHPTTWGQKAKINYFRPYKKKTTKEKIAICKLLPLCKLIFHAHVTFRYCRRKKLQISIQLIIID